MDMLVNPTVKQCERLWQ